MKPMGDPRSYRYSVLTNGLQVLNVLDPRAQTSALGVGVSSGQFYDPPELLGLAHLTEHAVFLGSKKFPEANGFDDYMAKFDGESNAYTDFESTVFYAAIDHRGFGQALSRLGDMLSQPTLNKDSIWDEVSAVISEHSKNLRDQSWRNQAVMRGVADQMSPEQGFHTGDASTLQAEGKEKLRDKMAEYFDANYCPQRMVLVTVGRESIDEQINAAVNTFKEIPKKGTNEKCEEKPKAFDKPIAFPPGKMGQWLRIEGSASTPQ